MRGSLLSKGFTHNHALPCLFVFRDPTGFVILVYMDDLNAIGTPTTCQSIHTLLTSEFQMKFLGCTSFCLGLQVHHLPDGNILLHQQNYIKKLLSIFQMDQAHPLAALIMGRSRTTDDPYGPCCEEEEILHKDQYLAAIGALIYLTTHTRPDTTFATNILARHGQ